MTKTQLLSLLALALAVTGCPRPLPPDFAANPKAAAELRAAIGGPAGEAAVQEVAEPTGWATLQGHFKVNGSVSLAPLKVDKDVSVCGASAPDLSAIVDAEGNLKDVLIFLSTSIPAEGEEKWIHPDYAKTADTPVVFDQKHCIFLSHVLPMRSTQPLEVLNSDPIGHNTKIDNFSVNISITPNGQETIKKVKALKEPAPVSCSIHPWMSAFIMATPHPYIAITDDQGKFKLENVPAGVPLEFRLWHERLRFIGGGTLDGSNANWPKGRMKLQLENDEDHTFEVVLDASKF